MKAAILALSIATAYVPANNVGAIGEPVIAGLTVAVPRKLDKPNSSGVSTVRQIVAEFHGGEEAEERAKWFAREMEVRG